MAFKNPFAARLGSNMQLQLAPNPQRSIFVQQLMARALQNNGRGSRSIAESADIAAAPIVAALLSKRDQAAQLQQQAQQKQMANQLLGNTLRTNIPLENLDGAPADTFSVPSMGPTDPTRQALAGVLAQNPQALTALAMQQVAPPKPAMTPYEMAQIGLSTRRLQDEEARPPPQETLHPVIDPVTGKPVLKPTSQAKDMTPYNPSAAAAADFSGPVGDLMGALAEKGYALPAGMRSKEQQAATFKAIVNRHPDQTPDEIASDIISGKIGLMTETQAAKEFSSSRQGTAGGTINAINTAVKHISSAMPLIDALQTGDVTALNRAKNYFQQNVGGSTAPTDFNAIKEFIQGEVAKAVIPGGGGEQERQALGASIAAANNPQAIKSAMTKIQIALAGKTDALRQQWNEATQGKQGDFDRFLLPETKQALKQAEMPSVAGASFSSEAEAEAAAKAGAIKSGDRITVNGVSGVWQ